MPILDVENLSYAYPASATKALKNISLQIGEGECVAIIGANNSGKTSLCYALTGVIPHLYHGEMEGAVRIFGNDTRTMNVSEIVGHIGLVMQNPENQLSGVRYTVFEEVAFGLENQGCDRREMRERVERALHMTDLTDLADRSPHRLSGGQMQKVILATVLAVNPPVLALDEPTTFLDPHSARQVFEILQRLRNAKKTIVFVEQRLEWVALFADRVIALYEGETALDGPPGEVLASALLKEIGLDWTRLTKVAGLARATGVWSQGKSLATTFSETVKGLEGR